MELRDYLHIILKYLWLIVLGGLLGLAVGLFTSQRLGYIPLYTATATVSVGGDVAAAERSPAYAMLADEFTQAYVSMATRGPVLQAAMEELGLQTPPNVRAAIVGRTRLIEVTASDRNPENAAAIANAVAHQLVELPSPRVRNFVMLVEEARVPTNLDTTWLTFTLVAGTLGMLLAGGGVFLLEFVRDPVYSAAELTRRTNLPVLATFNSGRSTPGFLLRGRKEHWRTTGGVNWWVLTQVCRRRFEELALPVNPHPRPARILVTAPTDGRATAIVATNLAVAWAETGARTVLIDADTRRPLLDKWFHLSDRPGLVDLLTVPADIVAVQNSLQSTDVPYLSVLPLGSRNGNAKGVFSPGSLEEVLQNLEACYDVVIVNGPPLLETEIGVMVAQQAHGVFLVLRVGQTTMEDVRNAQHTLALVESNVWGAILAEDH